MKIPLIVKGSPNCEPATVLVPKGKWKVESNHKDSVIALCHSSIETSVENSDIYEMGAAQAGAVRIKFLVKGTETDISVYLQKVS